VFPSEIVFCSLSGNHLYEGVEKNGVHPSEDLAKFGYDPYMKYKSFNIHAIFMPTH
jgi:hypothetical protein